MTTQTLAAMTGFVAVALQVGARVVFKIADEPGVRLGALFAGLAGVAILISAVRTIAVSKGRHPGWSFLGLFSIVGLIVVMCLKTVRKPAQAAAV